MMSMSSSSSPCSVLVALRASSKGKLSYRSPLDSDMPPAAKLEFLNQLTSSPPMSPEAIKIIEERTKRLSLTNHTPSPTVHTTHRTPTPSSSRQTSRGYSLNFEEVDYDLDDSANVTTTSLGISHVAVQGDSPSAVPTEHSLLEDMQQEFDEEVKSIDDRLLEEMNENIRYRRIMFERKIEDIRVFAMEKMAEMESDRERMWEQDEMIRRAQEEIKEHQIAQKQRALEEDYKHQAEVMEAKLKSGEEQKKIIEKRAVEKLMTQCHDLLDAASHTETKFTVLLKSCSHTQFLDQNVVNKVREGVAALNQVKTQLSKEMKSGHPDQKKVSQCRAQLTAVNPILAELKASVDQANQYGEIEVKKQQSLLEAAAKKLEAERLAKTAEEQTRDAERRKNEEKKKQDAKDGKKKDDGKTIGGDISGLQIPKSMIETYSALHDLHTCTMATTTSLTSTQDRGLKMYRFDLQKAVTGTINSVSSNSGQDLIGKIIHLKKLFSGQPVQVGTKTINIGAHPDAKIYCVNLLAAKMIKQGEDQIASSAQAAFPLAALAVGMWTEFKEIGHHLLAHFYSVCPVLVPMYVNRTKDMSEAEYMKSLGYNVSKDGVVESNDLFLNRVRGTVRFYAAIIQTPQLPTSSTPPPHPHGLEHGWMWLARMLNLEPHPVVTAAALGDFLEIAGHALMKKYTKQFQKLLFVLWKEFIPKIEKITPVADRGPLARLKLFIEGCISAGKIPEPKGYLTNEFWRTKSQGIAIA